MTRSSPSEVHRLFRAALDRPTEERPSFLAEACAGRPRLRAEVDVLLEQMPRAEHFLESPALECFAGFGADDDGPVGFAGRSQEHHPHPPGRQHRPDCVAPEPESPRRTVALKIMRSGFVAGSALRRFQYEAEVLGRLQHPNIAQIHEAAVHEEPGSPTRVPYFAIRIAGAGLGEADCVDVGVTAQIDGTLDVGLLGGYEPAIGSSFVILAADTIDGAFDTVVGPPGMVVEYFPDEIVVTFEEVVECPADVDGDGQVGFTDMLEVLANWGACAGCPADLDGDGSVDFADLLAVLAGWGPC